MYRNDTGSHLTSYPDLIICEHCDTVCRRMALASCHEARCETCNGLLYKSSFISLQSRFALSITAMVLYLIANFYPLLNVNLKGLHNEVTMWQAVLTLTEGEYAPIAIAVAFTLILVPLFQIVMINWILFFAVSNTRAPFFVWMMRCLSWLKPWSMLEVGLLGVVVSMVKLVSMMQVNLSAGVWALGILAAMMSLIADQEVENLWLVLPRSRGG